MAELAALHAALSSATSELVVAFSGGADSAFLARVAHDTLGPRPGARRHRRVAVAGRPTSWTTAAALAAEWGLRWTTVATDEMERAAYRVNDGERCYHCKSALMDALEPLRGARRRHRARRQHRRPRRPPPGPAGRRRASGGLPAGRGRLHARPTCGSWSPPPRPADLGQAGRGLPGVAAALRHARCRWPCCRGSSGRRPALRRLGFRAVRVRHYERTARIEVPAGGPGRGASSSARPWWRAVRAAGYDYVTLDLEGLRSGNLNAALAPAHAASRRR